MSPEYLGIADFIVTNSLLGWLGLRLVRRVDSLDKRVNDHETRIKLNERDIAYAKKKYTLD